MSGDIGGLADPYVTFNLRGKSKNPQTQTSSYRKCCCFYFIVYIVYNICVVSSCSKRRTDLNPRWLPPERFQFIVTSDEAGPTWPKILCDVIDFDTHSYIYPPHYSASTNNMSARDIFVFNLTNVPQEP